jgi:flagellar biosynthesis protein
MPKPEATGTRPENRASAVALAYQNDDSAPRIVAKGHGLIAQEIIDRARAAGVYVHESRELVALLMQVDLDQTIPSELYIAVAELLAWIYALEHGGHPPPSMPPNDIVQQTAKA